MKHLKRFFKTKLEVVLYIYIFISVILHILYNIYLKDNNFILENYYVDKPLFTINNIFILLFELLIKLFEITNYGFIYTVLDSTTNIGVNLFNLLISIKYLNILIESINWIIMYILFAVITIILIIKKFFEFTIKISLVIAIVYVIYTIFYQYTFDKTYLKLEYISTDYFEGCECEKIEVVDIVDGDTIKIKYNNIEETVRLLYIDTPEATKEVEEYGYDATLMLKSLISSSNQIYIEFDGNRRDKYNRLLGWIWIDNVLAQEILTKNGLVEDFYDYGDYKYENIMHTAMKYAKDNKIKIYKN